MSVQGRVALETTGGQRIEGRPWLLHTVETPTGKSAEVEVEQDDGTDVPILVSDIATVSVVPQDHLQESIATVQRTIRNPGGVPEGEPVEWLVPVGEHEELEISIRRLVRPCAPDYRRPRIVFSLVTTSDSNEALGILHEEE
ncbi:hypothetical protein QOZ88_20685 [Blastococcus sp. BMG 814]|uniref:Uncharacterized protein n=1 Tax=Blastococcus carthaginiensis TaxID=3050034 RepID=A0ABT9IHJ8_9ACTN|nr:hypothetical protein [Blastococcus carthaginiensis]MDP5185056.1 hypothetical protein [Blastococcus carthaginiensis]